MRGPREKLRNVQIGRERSVNGGRLRVRANTRIRSRLPMAPSIDHDLGQGEQAAAADSIARQRASVSPPKSSTSFPHSDAAAAPPAVRRGRHGAGDRLAMVRTGTTQNQQRPKRNWRRGLSPRLCHSPARHRGLCAFPCATGSAASRLQQSRSARLLNFSRLLTVKKLAFDLSISH